MNLDRALTVHKPLDAQNRHVAVLYLHGGGLLYGGRNDLPQSYITQFLDAGYTLVCADYPLAPESHLPSILDHIFETWKTAIAEPLEHGKYSGYLLFGRSSGAYLSLLLAREIRRQTDQEVLQPLGILDFYGYHTLLDIGLTQPAKAYTKLPNITRKQVSSIYGKSDGPIMSGPKSLRYALYVHARQHENAWLDLIGIDASKPQRTAEAWSLTDQDISQLPPIFITASTDDGDIPFRLPKTLWRKAPKATIKPVYYLPHDFDRDTSNPTGATVYNQAIEWMDTLQTL